MSRAVLKLEPRLDTAAAGTLAAAILEQTERDLELDASAVTHFGAMAVQVLRAAARTWKRDGVSLTLSGLSAECMDQIGLLGFSADAICTWDHD